MSIKDIREYLGMPRPQFCEYYEIKQRTLEDWEYGKNPVPQRMINKVGAEEKPLDVVYLSPDSRTRLQ